MRRAPHVRSRHKIYLDFYVLENLYRSGMRNGKNGSESPHLNEARLANQEILDYECKVNKALARLNRRESFETSTRTTALDEILADEEAPRCPRCRCPVPIDSPAALEQFAIRVETIKRMADFCSFNGVEPWNVLSNVYAIFAHMGLRPWVRLTLRQKAVLLGESHGSQHLRIKKLVNFLREENAASFKAPGQKQIESGSSYSKCQEGNSNRRRQNRSRHHNRKRKEKMQRR